jgi:hypothetical protein
LADISERARAILGAVDLIACEDTRTTGAMLTRFGIRRELAPYHEHNETETAEKLASLLSTDQTLRRFFEGETRELPGFYTDQMRADLGPWWDFLPDGALQHDQNAYLRASDASFLAEPVPAV